jgi:hypothetical protein
MDISKVEIIATPKRDATLVLTRMIMSKIYSLCGGG